MRKRAKKAKKKKHPPLVAPKPAKSHLVFQDSATGRHQQLAALEDRVLTARRRLAASRRKGPIDRTDAALALRSVMAEAERVLGPPPLDNGLAALRALLYAAGRAESTARARTSRWP
jgi:hypothetical protein